MSEIRVDRIKDEAGSGAVELTEGATIPSGKNLTGAGGINITGNIVTTGTLTYEDVTNVDSVGIVTARSGLQLGASGVGGTITGAGHAEFVGLTTARGGLEVGASGAGATITSVGDAEFAGLTTARFGGVTETVSVGSTTLLSGGSGKDVILELDCSKGTVFSHDLDTGGPVGIVSIKNFRVNTNTFTTATVIFTQHSSAPSGGVGNTMVASVPGGFPGGIGTEVTLAPLGVAANAGIATNARVGTATTITLSTTGGDVDVVTFGIHYNGGGSGSSANYTAFATKNGDFRYGLTGV